MRALYLFCRNFPSNLSKCLSPTFFCSIWTGVIIFVISTVLFLFLAIIFTTASVLAAFITLNPYVRSNVYTGAYPCEIYVIYKNAFPCSFPGLIFEIFTWLIILIVPLIIIGVACFVIILYGLCWCRNDSARMETLWIKFIDCLFCNKYSGMSLEKT